MKEYIINWQVRLRETEEVLQDNLETFADVEVQYELLKKDGKDVVIVGVIRGEK